MATQAACSPAVCAGVLVATLLQSSSAAAAALEGRVLYPGRGVPAATVYARNVETAALHAQVLARNEATFRFELPAGKYWVFVRPSEPGLTELYGAFSRYSVCRLQPDHLVETCGDHSMHEVEVGTGTRPAPLVLDDWFLDDAAAAELDRILGTASPAPDEAELGRPRFSEYRATAEAPGEVKLDLPAGSRAASFARELRAAAGRGANFAGAFAIVRLPCDAACEQIALVDFSDGSVSFPESLARVPTALPCRPDRVLFWREDSRLLEVTRRDAESRDAVTIVTDYLLWNPARRSFSTLAQYRRNLDRFCGKE